MRAKNDYELRLEQSLIQSKVRCEINRKMLRDLPKILITSKCALKEEQFLSTMTSLLLC